MVTLLFAAVLFIAFKLTIWRKGGPGFWGFFARFWLIAFVTGLVSVAAQYGYLAITPGPLNSPMPRSAITPLPLTAVAFPTATNEAIAYVSSPTGAPPAYGILPTGQPLPHSLSGMTPITERRLYVCVQTANVRSGPGTNYPVTKQLISESYVTAYGKLGEWYYVGYDDQGVDQFVHQSVLCDQPSRSPQGSALSTSTPTCEDLRNEEIDLTGSRPSKYNVSQDYLDYCENSSPGAFDPLHPQFKCQEYNSVPTGYDGRAFVLQCPIRAITKPNGIKVYYTSDEAEYETDNNYVGQPRYFASAAEAEAAGFVPAHPK